MLIGYARVSTVDQKLDRLGRSLGHLVETLAALGDRGIGFRSLQESVDTTTSGGKLVFHVFAALAEFERDLIRERTRAGLDAARARGKRRGRRHKLDEKKRAQALTLHRDRTNTVDDICRTLRVLFFANRGKIRRKQEEEQVQQATCLNLLTNCVITWNTVYMAAAIDRLRIDGHSILEEDIAHVSPCRYEHINPYGKYAFDVGEALGGARLRPGRPPA
jgi:hypothetical protein